MIRDDFPILKRKIRGCALVYFDNAASMQKPQAVISALNSFYSQHYANIHRAIYPLAEQATELYEGSRQTVASFIGASPEEVIFTKGATEGINLVARSWGEANLHAGDRIVLTRAEHHANLVPWLQLKDKLGIKLEFIELKKDGSLDLESARKKINLSRVKMLSITQASNVLGVVYPVEKLIRLARLRKIVTLIDASQSVAHLPIKVKRLDSDFLVFSGHKLGGPTGIGVLYGRREILDNLAPFLGGGDMIESVKYDSYTVAPAPQKFEAGTPPIAGAIGLAAACRYFEGLGWKKIQDREDELTNYFRQQLKQFPFIRLIGNAKNRLPVFSLVIEGLHPHDAADWLGQEGIALRAGFHCAEPLHSYYGIGATLRASLSVYNTKSEIDYFFKKITELYIIFNH